MEWFVGLRKLKKMKKWNELNVYAKQRVSSKQGRGVQFDC